MHNDNLTVPVIFGEVLFDCFPDGNSVLGGAPFNVAWHLQALGLSPLMITAVGNDELGKKVQSAMQDWRMDISGLQLDQSHPTGSVDVSFEDGEPSYSIVEHRAYDYIDAGALPSIPGNSIVYHGSLALRNRTSRDTLSTIKQNHAGRLFMDVNLRDPWWEREFVLSLVDDADWVKLNEDELALLGSHTGDIETRSLEFLRQYGLQGLITTLGSKGAMAFTSDGDFSQVEPSMKLDVVDTVGAGDAFTSILILGLSRQWPLALTMKRAQAFASLMVTQQGATVHRQEFYQEIIDEWGL